MAKLLIAGEIDLPMYKRKLVASNRVVTSHPKTTGSNMIVRRFRGANAPTTFIGCNK